MKNISFTINVEPATKKNSSRIIKAGGYTKIIPSKKYIEFEKKCMPEVIFVRNAVGMIIEPVNIRCTFYMKTKRKVDLSNLLNAIDDTFTKYGLIYDDNRDIIAGHDGSRVFYDKNNPRIEIEITKMYEYLRWKEYKT